MTLNIKRSVTDNKTLLIIAVSLFVLDQLTKFWVLNNIAPNSYSFPYHADVIEVIKDFFYIVHVGNEGAAWGIFAGHREILALLAVVAIVAIFKFRHSLELHRKPMQFAFGMLIGGVLGNLVDRIQHGHVIDFLDFHLGFTIPWILPNGRYPAFNIADCGIVIGVFSYMIVSLIQSNKREVNQTT